MGAAPIAGRLRTAAVLALVLAPAAAAQGPPHAADRDSHGNPDDLDAYAAHLEAPARASWQKPDQVVAALGLRPGQTACDIGAGPGYFSLRLARAVGPQGRVFAVDVEPRLLTILRERLAAGRLRNVTPVLAVFDDPLLPDGACDVVLIVDTYHHFNDGPAYLRGLQRALRPGGRIANIDYQKRATPVGPPLAHRVAREDFLADARSAGLSLAAEPRFLPYQYFLVLKRR